MQVIELDGSEWSGRLALFDALAEALRVCAGHGRGFDAFEDSVFYGGMSEVEPPFHVVVMNCPVAFEADVEQMKRGWAHQRQWKLANYGEDVEATIELRR
jgi:hypothetical protein